MRRPAPSPRRAPARALLAAALLLAGCRAFEGLQDRLAPETPHEAYGQALDAAGLGASALARAWRAAAAAALRAPAEARPPFREAGYFDPAAPEAAGYAFALPRGRRLTVRVVPPPPDPGAAPDTNAVADTARAGRLFVDLFRLPDDSTGVPTWVAGPDGAAADTLGGAPSFTYDAPRDGRYVLRLQPELLHGGRYTVVLETGPSLGFPVAGYDAGAVRSFWGAPRDGGARRHEGVDVFTPRGTPAIAAADGVVRRLGEGGLGGRAVWLGARGYGLYYAHLDTQLVAPGQRVAAGDTVGLVGSTGNASGGPPHLHFGVYAPNLGGALGGSGAVDPLPFLAAGEGAAPAVAADEGRPGGWVRTRRASALRAGPAPDDEVARALGRDVPAHVPARVLGASRGAYRVALPDGTTGYLDARATEPAERPLRVARLPEGRPLLTRPAPSAPAADTVAAGAPLDVLGLAGAFWRVRTPGGREGWVQTRTD